LNDILYTLNISMIRKDITFSVLSGAFSWDFLLDQGTVTPRSIIATGGQKQEIDIRNSVTFKKIEAYVKH